MKKLLLLLILLPSLANAQSFRLRLGGGVSAITNPEKTNYFQDTRLAIVPCIQLSGAFVISKSLEAGLDISGASYKRIGQASNIYSGLVSGSEMVDRPVYLTNPALKITPSLSVVHGGLFAGPHAGIVVPMSWRSRNDPMFNNIYYDAELGYCFGIHVGYFRNIAHAFGAYANASATFVTMSGNADIVHTDGLFMQAEITAGIQYQFK